MSQSSPRPSQRQRPPRWCRLGYAVDAEAAFAELFATEPYAFWLDSSRTDGPARFSFVGASAGPQAEILVAEHETGVEVRSQDGARRVNGSLFDVLTARLAARALPDTGPLPPEVDCGYVGYFGYELPAGGPPSRHSPPVPDAVWLAPTRYIAIDHWEGQTWILSDEESTEWLYHAERVVADLPSPGAVRTDDDGFGVDPEPWLVRLRSRYLRDIEACLAALRAGESYEICLTDLVEMPFAGDPFAAYRRLRRTNPAPYGAYLRFDDVHVLSSSPERFLSVGPDRVARASPIKGTAPRHPDPDRDAALAKQLRDSPKTRAENLMIVDLLRNDLGRVCEPGSISVPDFLAVESYATVHQLVSTIQGRLRSDVDAVAAVRACFPPGSMTGAPKYATMRILDELETRARGVYSGALGRLGRTGTADLSVVIRTAVVADETVRVGAGGAIVLDSDPAEEYAEMLLKAATPLRAFGPAAKPGQRPRQNS